MKTKWITPRTEIETFIPNEYIAACWGVKCDITAANAYEQQIDNWMGGQISHTPDHCGTNSNQVITDENEDGIADKMTEVGTDGLGNLNCLIYWDNEYKRPRDISTVNIGNQIFWTTTAGGKVWHHQGTVTGKNINRPNMS